MHSALGNNADYDMYNDNNNNNNNNNNNKNNKYFMGRVVAGNSVLRNSRNFKQPTIQFNTDFTLSCFIILPSGT
jgi:hypothetical protein